MNQEPALRIAVVASVLLPYDAISNDVVRTAGFLAADPRWQVSVLAGANLREDIRAHVVSRASDLLIAPEFIRADLIVYHFGIYYPLFDAILIGNRRARQAVVFHNITPPHLVPEESRATIEMSFAQLRNLHAADAIWSDSRENQDMLLARGFPVSKMAIQPLAVTAPALGSILRRSAGPIRVVAICRIVPAKGVHDLIEAVGRIDPDLRKTVKLSVVGNLSAAEPSYRAGLLQRIQALGLADTVEFLESISDAQRDSLLADSHILAVTSYHEGFCVPVIEALRAGMLPVVYAGSNLRYVAAGLCMSAEEGNVAAFAAALECAVQDMMALRRDPNSAVLRVERGDMRAPDFERATRDHLRQFESDSVAQSLRRLATDVTTRDCGRPRDAVPALHIDPSSISPVSECTLPTTGP